ncbi:MAG: peptidoglycan DD-metalloendopeptidase family protein [Clostridia bacterium]|nr:peptidoglycan DD-metalloendopeptidase family protein [Clostridia bacterium]
MSGERRKIYKAVARGLKRDEKRRVWKLRVEQERPLIERWTPLLIFALLVAGFLFGFVFRGAKAVKIEGRRLGYVKNEEDYAMAVELLTSDVREDLGRERSLPEGITLEKSYVPFFAIEEPASFKAVLMDACGESFTYRYVYYIGEKELGAVTAKERKAVGKMIEDHRKSLVGNYSWAENVEVIGDVWNSFRLAEEKDYVTPADIARKLGESDGWFTVRYQYHQTDVETYPYGIDYTYTRELLESETEVVSAGKNGVVSTLRCFTGENGKVTRVDIESRDVISEPVNAVIRKGNRRDTGYYFYAPVDSGKISSEFGYRILRGKRNWHSGVDFKVPEGTNVYATAAGVVTKVGVFGNGDYGEAVVIDHGDGFVTYYAHNSELLVKVGDRVKKGTLIALSGNTGNSTGPHCHFEVRLNEEKVDPFLYMERPDPEE